MSVKEEQVNSNSIGLGDIFPLGLSEDVVRAISAEKNEPDWMLDFRLKSFEIFKNKSLPNWGADLSSLDLKNITYYLRPQDKAKTTWEDLPE